MIKTREEVGGFVRKPPKSGYLRRRASATPPIPKKDKSPADIQAEREEAQERWAGVPLIVAREMIAESGLGEEEMASVTMMVSLLNPDELEKLGRKGLDEVLTEMKLVTNIVP